MGKRGFTLNPFRSISTRLFYITFFSVLFFVTLTGTISYLQSKDILTLQASEESLKTVEQAKDKIDLKLIAIEGVGLQVMANTELKSLLYQMKASGLSAEQMEDLRYRMYRELMSIQAMNGGIELISIFSADGSMPSMSSEKNAKPVNDYVNTEWFKQTMSGAGKPVWLPTRKESYSSLNSPTFALGRSMETVDENTGFVMLIEIRTDILNEQLDEIVLGKSGSVRIVDKSNIVMETKDPSLLGSTEIFDLNASKDGKQQAVHNDVEYLVLNQVTERAGWQIVGQVPVTELNERASQILNNTVLVAAFSVLAALLIGFSVVRRVVKPLETLSQLMQRGEQGELSVRADANRPDEIGQLASSFNRMMEQINKLVYQTNRTAKDVMDTSKQVFGVSGTIKKTSSDVTQSVKQVSAGAIDMSRQAENGNDLSHKMGQEIKSVLASTNAMWTAAHQVQKSSTDGTYTMRTLTDQTNRIEEITNHLNAQVSDLRENTVSIRDVLILLFDLTRNINILAINAGIEATKAGIHGKGFMVVASEMRRLADQSSDSIGRAESIINRIEYSIDDTANTLDRATPMFQTQMDSVRKTDAIFEAVSGNMNELVKRIDQVTAAISKLNESSVQLSSAMESVTAVSEEASATSEEVVQLSMGQLKVSESMVDLSARLDELAGSLSDSLARFKM